MAFYGLSRDVPPLNLRRCIFYKSKKIFYGHYIGIMHLNNYSIQPNLSHFTPTENKNVYFCGKNKLCPPTNTNLQEALGQENVELLNRIRLIGKAQNQETFLFGGAVRDCLLGEKPHDLDIIVNGDALNFARQLKKTDRKLFSRILLKTPVKRAIVHTNGMNMDIVPLCSDGSYVSGKDAIRAAINKKSRNSDFSVNSMIIKLDEDKEGHLKLKLIDYMRAKKDLKENRLRTLNKDEFAENPVLALRGKRYQKRYKMSMDSETKRLINENIRNPKKAGNPLRVIKELYKFAMEQKDPFVVLRFLFNYKIFK